MSFIFIFPTVVQIEKASENAAVSDFVDKSYVKNRRRPRLNESAFANFNTLSDLLHKSDRLINSRRFIDKSSRKSESLIDAIAIPCIEKLGTASTCRERQ